MTPEDDITPASLDAAGDRSQPTCLITGGSGFLGINLVRYLLQHGMSLRTLDIAPFDYPEQVRIDAWQGDIRDGAAVDQALEGVTTVVHCAAALPLAPAAEIMSTGVDGTRTLLEASLRHGVRRFIFTSSTAVYGIPEHHPIREDDALRGVGPYGNSKIQAEQLCAEFRRHGVCVPVLRPKTFIGPERLGVFEILYEWAFEGRRFPVLGRGDNAYQLLDVADLCEVIHRCMVLDEAVVNDVFNVGALDIGTMKENVQAVLDRAGHGSKAVCLPAAPAVLALRVLHALKLSPLYEWIYRTADRDSVVSIDRLQSRLGYTPTRSNRSALEANYDWYVQHRHEFQGHVGISHRTPWRKGVLGWAKWCF
ncbi:NAD-dependent epimerase/dehydratase family protein [Azohydromonas australica]|uniref:NAD-dependent epimerase/dehydratase family protein n=1 Tax=Azohydromonas australica TaxID=364039 RepID=UPI000410C745|nr:NAD(P)-dependent oxidoreductase [Azohydromonas australica]